MKHSDSEHSGSGNTVKYSMESGAGKSWVVSKILADERYSTFKEAATGKKGIPLWLMDDATRKSPFTQF